MPVSAEGRVENQKLNQTAALLSFGWVFDIQLDLLEKKLTTLPGFTFNSYIIFLVFNSIPWRKSLKIRGQVYGPKK